ncbi:MAG: CotH kinase family protein [Verrucomicrobia bacterium]|nr:CotH kinase family protein [Verrucomicrobiota bacterium]
MASRPETSQSGQSRCGARGPAALGLALAAFMAASAHAANPEIVINEVMFHPPLDRDDLQFVELFNRGPSPADLSGWYFTHGIKFVFPPRTLLPANGFLVLCRNKPAFVRQYGSGVAVAGEFGGKLSHSGEKLELADAGGEVVDAVGYSDREPWPTGADGHSASLERICPFAASQEPGNWSASSLPAIIKPAGTPGRTNDSYSSHLPPLVKAVRSSTPKPGEAVSVTAEVSDADGLGAVTLRWQLARPGTEAPETEAAMTRLRGDEKGGTYQALIPAQPPGVVVRFRVQAIDAAGATRWRPSPNEPRPTYTFSTFVNTNTARIPFAYVLNSPLSAADRRARPRGRLVREPAGEPVRGTGTFVYAPPGGGEVLTFDHVLVRSRTGGFKVHFQKDRPLQGMTSINLIFEDGPRRVLSEPLAYELFRAAGVPAPWSAHVRVWVDGRPLGYQLLVEQPNKSFLTRNQRDSSGHLYKLNWRGHGVVGQHEKRTRESEGHGDLVQLIDALNAKTGADQWKVIRQQFHVEELASYYAVNMCIQNWDGFWNNYYAYHDTGGSGRWEVFPWDEDKTWGDFDGTSRNYDWYDMPLTFGMNGVRPPLWNPLSRANGPHGGPAWWRRPGWFSGPLLANPDFRQQFLRRLRELCETDFTEKKLLPVIDEMEKRLEPEIAVRARVLGADPRQHLDDFRRHLQSLRNQVKHRRQFILDELNKPTGLLGVLVSPLTWFLLGLVAAVTGLVVVVRRSFALRKSFRVRPYTGPAPPRLPIPPRPVPPPLPRCLPHP